MLELLITATQLHRTERSCFGIREETFTAHFSAASLEVIQFMSVAGVFLRAVLTPLFGHQVSLGNSKRISENFSMHRTLRLKHNNKL